MILCVANLSRSAQATELDLSAWKDRVPLEMLGRTKFPAIGELPYMITLAPYGSVQRQGVPPTLGFFGKFELIREVMQVGEGAYTPYVVLMVLNSVVAAFYYLRVTVWVYFRPEGRVAREYIREPSLNWAMAIAALVIVLAGALPFRPMNLASRAGHDVRTSVAARHLILQAPERAPQPGDEAKAGQ